MAALVESSSSSDESFENEILETRSGLRGYQFEPRRELPESEDSPVESEDSSSDDGGTVDRLTTVNWCACRRCSTDTIQRNKECICCRERANTRSLGVETNTDVCITNNPDFRLLCLTPVVLRNVLVALNNVRADHWDVNPPNNRGLRYAAYRQFTWWAHGRLGAGKRRVLPACATHAIRQEFPKTDQEEYVGFYSGEVDSDE